MPVVNTGLPYTQSLSTRGHAKYTLAHDFFHDIKTEEQAYVLGFIAADGCVNTKRGCIRIKLKSTDKPHLEKIKTTMLCNKLIYDVKGLRNGTICYGALLELSSKALVADLAALGIGSRKSLTLATPIIREDLYKHYYRGLIDGDGSIYYIQRVLKTGIKKVPCFYLVGSKCALDGFTSYIKRTLGIELRIHIKGAIFQVHARAKSSVISILDHLYTDSKIYLDRKNTLAKEILSNANSEED